MDKRAAKIVICCVACSLIVLIIFLIAFKFSEDSCELIQVDPQHLRESQLQAFNKDKPTRSEDKTLLLKFSAYLEYNKLKSDKDDEDDDNKSEESSSSSRIAFSTTNSPSLSNNNNNNNSFARQAAAPNPSNPLGFLNGGLNQNASAAIREQQQQLAKKRFLPLDLDSIETRHLNQWPGNKYKYILEFNCTKLNMVFVRHSDRVYVESMKLDLDVKHKHQSECEVQLPPGGEFALGFQSGPGQAPFSSLSNIGSSNNSSSESPTGATGKNKEFLHYYCNKPMRYKCYYTKNGQSHLLAELHINGIEYETSVNLNNGSGSDMKLKHVNKNEFKTKRRECELSVS